MKFCRAFWKQILPSPRKMRKHQQWCAQQAGVWFCLLGVPLGRFWLAGIGWVKPGSLWEDYAGLGSREDCTRGCCPLAPSAGEANWLWVKTNGIPFWGRCATHPISVGIGMFTGGHSQLSGTWSCLTES